MPRKPAIKPWLHQASGYWCITIFAKRHYLDLDYHTACQKLNAIRTKQTREDAGAVEWLDAPFITLTGEYLDDLKQRRKENTYRGNRYRLLRVWKILGTELRVGQVKKFHLNEIEKSMTGSYSPTTISDTLTTVIGVFNWAVKYDFLTVNPLIGYAKPARLGRTRIILPAEFQALLRHSDVAFRRVLIAARLTGCRPGELRSLIWEWVNLDSGFIIFPDHKTITMQRKPMPRIVPLPKPIWKLCRWLARRNSPRPADHVFLNMRGKPYTKDCLVTKMARIRLRAGIEKVGGENIILYSNRHSYATEIVGRVSDFELATLLGHTDSQMVKRYAHLNQDRLRDIQRRAAQRPD